MKHSFILIISLLLVAMLVNCAPSDYRANKHFPGEKWPQSEKVLFNFTPLQSGLYQPSIWIRHTTNYPYQNFHCLFTLSQGHVKLLTDTVHFTTTTPDGNWKGQGLQGLKTITSPMSHPVSLDSACLYQITIQHLMTDDTLQALKDVGILFKLQTPNH